MIWNDNALCLNVLSQVKRRYNNVKLFILKDQFHVCGIPFNPQFSLTEGTVHIYKINK